ncbi:MAG: FadR/GntR family transcriptional regulator [Lactimicrobium sp.]|uniref:FadR/GntR family transcriptional regulator n=1 Tax=Lactimicrobium sp. TaxID=2563780 RepID=UPI002F3589ED
MAVIRTTVAQQVADTIVADIESGKIKPGEKIKNEFEIAADLNVGRGSVREAVKQLVSRGILEIRRGDGTYVQKQPGMVDDPLGFAFDTDKKKLAYDLCEFRLLTEPEIARLAAERADDAERALIRMRCNACADDIRNGRIHFEDDVSFHGAIVAATHNDVMQRVIPVIHEGVAVLFDYTIQEQLDYTLMIHEKICQAIENKDLQAAYDAMLAHMKENQRWIQQCFANK